MKRTYVYLLLISLSVFLLTGCAQEPMIKISEENQASIDSKLANGNSEQNPERLNESQPSSEMSSPSKNEPPAQLTLVPDPSEDWTPAPSDTQYDLWEYTPFLMNQIKEFSNGTQVASTYMTYGQEDLASFQVEQRQTDELETALYQVENNQINRITQSDSLNPYDNVLDQISTMSEGDSVTLLQGPLTVGTSWKPTSTRTSSITAMYESIPLEAGEITNVVEVTTEGEGQIIKHYYAQNQGLVAIWLVAEGENEGVFWQLTSDSRNVMLIHPVTVFSPSTSEEELTEQSDSAFVWQTNGSLAYAFQQIFTDLGIIDATITVNDVYLDENNVAVIDFSPGVVSIMNQHEASEASVIRSVVETLGTFFDTNQVRLTVSGNGLLPNTVEYPEAGIYQLESTD